jgi:hypothetical protein
LNAPVKISLPHSHANGVARLNLFQRLVRQWETLHPYNAIQVMKVRGAIDPDTCRAAWHETLEALGLGRVNLIGNSYKYECLNGDAALHPVHRCAPGTDLDAFCAEQMNLRFDDRAAMPFRPFMLQESDGCWLGMAYRHWVADGTSARRLMGEWFLRLFDPSAAAAHPVRTEAGGYLELFGPHRSQWSAVGALSAMLRWQSQLRLAKRIEERGQFVYMPVRYLRRTLPEGSIQRISAAARKLGVKVNDLFTAAIAESCQRFIPCRPRNGRRDIAIGNIVDLRSRTPRRMDDVFNLLLGFTNVLCRPEDFGDWHNLVNSVARQTQRHKTTSAAETSWVRMAGGLVVGKMLSQKKVLEFYRKRVALSGACTNLNLNGSWAEKYYPDPLMAYFRAAPTGPMTPVVFAATTLGGVLSLGLTYRFAILGDVAAQSALDMTADRLQSL